MRVKPYPMRSPPRNARHTALWASGGWMSTSGCSCRYRSSLGSCSGGPGGTSGTGQYRYPVSGQRNSFPKSHAIRLRRRGHGVPSAPLDRPARMTNRVPPEPPHAPISTTGPGCGGADLQSRSTGSPVSASTRLIASIGQDAAASRTASSGPMSAVTGPDRCLSSSSNRPGAVPTHTADPMHVFLSTVTTQRVTARPTGLAAPASCIAPYPV